MFVFDTEAEASDEARELKLEKQFDPFRGYFGTTDFRQRCILIVPKNQLQQPDKIFSFLASC